MSTLLDETEIAEQPLPADISARLQTLRSSISLWFVIEGCGRLLWTALALAAGSFLLDYSFRLDHSQRTFLLVVMLALLAYAWFARLFRPLTTTISDDGLLLEVERRHPELAESLISAVQFARLGKQVNPQTSPEMVQATIKHGLEAAWRVSFNEVLNSQGLWKNIGVLLLGGGLLLGLGVASFSVPHIRIWFQRNVLLQKQPWPQNTYLQIPRAKNGVLRIPRGDDYTLQVEVTADSKIVPANVFIDFRDGRGSLAMKKSAEQQFEAQLANVIQPFQFRLRGGDELTEYYSVELVEPPALDTIALEVTLPKYAGGATETLPAGKGPYFILPGSELKITGTANKPLQSAALTRGDARHELTITQEKTVSGVVPANALQTGQYVIDLTDSEGLQAKRPAAFGLRLRADREPRVRAKLIGIGGMVTARARIPLNCRVSDDYGITQVAVEYRWRGDDAERKEGKGQLPLSSAKVENRPLELAFDDVLELEPLAIPTGTGFEFYLHAADNDDFADDDKNVIPNVGRSPDFSIRVVTDDELRSDLLRREKEQRQEFERLVKQQDDLLTLCRELVAQLDQKEEFTREQKDKLAQLPKNEKLIGTNAGTIGTRLGSIVIEIENNRLENADGPLQSRLRSKILEPLTELGNTEFPEAVKRLESARRATGDFPARREITQQAAEQMEKVTARMKEILSQMAQAEGFQEAVNLLFELQKAQEEVLQRTKKSKEERQKEIIEGAGASNEKKEAPPEKKE
jgi:hypothetical protein